MASMERFTQRARRVLSLAHKEAERMQHAQIGTEHLLLGLLLDQGGIAGRVLRELGLDVDSVLICGAMSHMCIDAVTRAANDFGYHDFSTKAIPASVHRV